VPIHGPPYTYQHYPASHAAEDSDLVFSVARVFSNSFGTNSTTGQPYRLGPKTTKNRLRGAKDLVVAVERSQGITVGYVYGRSVDSEQGIVLWIDSLAVLPDHRRLGLGTSLVRAFTYGNIAARWVGCDTPNRVAALVITTATGGKPYAGICSPPPQLLAMMEDVRGKIPDLQGADFNPVRLLVRTRFSPASTGDSKEWTPPHPSEPPPWWGSLEHLPSEYEALLIIDRHDSL
jgi:hypothetical protein